METAGGRRQGKAFGGNGRKGARWDGTASAGGEVEKNKSFRSSSQDEVRWRNGVKPIRRVGSRLGRGTGKEGTSAGYRLSLWDLQQESELQSLP